MAETVASQAVDLINEVGIFDIIVPFIISAAALYGMLEKSKIFGEGQQEVNAIISLGVGVIVALSWSARSFILNFIPLLIVLAFFLFVAILLIEWIGVKPDFFTDLMKQPAVLIPSILIILVLVMIAQSGGLDLISGRANYTGEIGVPTDNITAEDLTNPMVVLTQPQIAGTLLLLTVFAVISFMITQKK